MTDSPDAAIDMLLGLTLDSAARHTLRLILRLAIAVATADEGSLLVLDTAARDLCFVMTDGDGQSDATLRGRHVALGTGPVGLAAATLEPHAGPPRVREPRLPDGGAGPVRQPEMEIAAPIIVGGSLFGVLTAVSFAPETQFAASTVRLFGGFATIAGVLIEQAQRLHPIITEDADLPAGQSDGAERRILRAVHRIAAHRPDALSHLAVVVEQFAQVALAHIPP